jgi:hypothetical protein
MKPKMYFNEHCVQCGEEVIMHDFTELYYCINVECPNYGLIQMSIEYMPLAKTEEKKNEKLLH